MYKLFAVSISLLIIQFSGCSSADKREISEDVRNFFGEKILTVITDADKGYSYRVKPEKSKSPRTKNLQGYPVTAEGRALASDDLDSLKNILLDEGTYGFNNTGREPVLPEYAFVLLKGDQQVAVFFDLSRRRVLFVNEGWELVESFDNAEKDVRDFINRFFKLRKK